MKKSLTLVAFLFIVIQVFQAQTADDVINKYFESVGGIDKWKSLKSMKMTGNLYHANGRIPVYNLQEGSK